MKFWFVTLCNIYVKQNPYREIYHLYIFCIPFSVIIIYKSKIISLVHNNDSILIIQFSQIENHISKTFLNLNILHNTLFKNVLKINFMNDNIRKYSTIFPPKISAPKTTSSHPEMNNRKQLKRKRKKIRLKLIPFRIH